MALTLFPARSAIGVATGPDGKKYDVFMTVEFARMLSDWYERAGGDTGSSNTDIEALAAQASIPAPVAPEPAVPPLPVAEIAALQQELWTLRQLVQQMGANLNAAIAPLRDKSADAERLTYAMAGSAFKIDWERPGKIGRIKPNTGSFTVLTVGAGTVALPSLYFGTDTTTGLYRIGANNIGVSVGGTKRIDISGSGLGVTGNIDVTGVYVKTGVAISGNGGQVRHVDDTGALRWVAGLLGSAGASNYTVYDNISGVPCLIVFPGGTVGVATTLQVGGLLSVGSGAQIAAGFGCNGATPQGTFALGAAPTDLPTSIAAITNLQTALKNNGIGS